MDHLKESETTLVFDTENLFYHVIKPITMDSAGKPHNFLMASSVFANQADTGSGKNWFSLHTCILSLHRHASH